MVGDAKIWYVRTGVSKMVYVDVAPRGDLGLPAIVHGSPQRFHPKHSQNGKPILPAVACFDLENVAGGQGQVLVPLAPSAYVDVELAADDGGQDVLVPLFDELLVDDPPPPTTGQHQWFTAQGPDSATGGRRCWICAVFCSVGYLPWLDVRLALFRWAIVSE